MIDALYVPPKPAIIMARRPEIVRPGDPNFIVPGGLILNPFGFAPEPIGVPVGLGSGSSASGTTVAITGYNVTAGRLVVVAIGCWKNPVNAVSTLSDGVNTYTLAGTAKAQTSVGDTEIWYCANALAVTGGTLTATFTGSHTGAGIAATSASGIIASPLDKSNNSVASTETPTVATGTLAQANEIIFAASGRTADPAVLTYTEDAAFTNLYSKVGSTNYCFSFAYKIVAATTTITHAPTWTGGAGTQAPQAIASFMGN